MRQQLAHLMHRCRRPSSARPPRACAPRSAGSSRACTFCASAAPQSDAVSPRATALRPGLVFRAEVGRLLGGRFYRGRPLRPQPPGLEHDDGPAGAARSTSRTRTRRRARGVEGKGEAIAHPSSMRLACSTLGRGAVLGLRERAILLDHPLSSARDC
jgi:hypothetical protein